jgi:phospholipid/cholesterol/gamma-HCH transport system permease protein
VIAALGRMVLSEVRRTLAYATLTVLAFTAIVRRPREGAAVVRQQIARQIVFSAWDGIPFVALIGAVVSMSTIAVTVNLLPGGQTPQLVERVLTFVLVRELAPWMTAIIVILRSCSAITVELGTMSARGEIEAMQTLGIDPAKMLLLPRFAGMIVAQVALTVVFVLSAFVAGVVTANLLGVAAVFDNIDHLTAAISPADLGVGLFKSTLVGIIVAAVACYHGLSVRRDPTEIPRRVTRSLTEAMVHCTLTSGLVTLATS